MFAKIYFSLSISPVDAIATSGNAHSTVYSRMFGPIMSVFISDRVMSCVVFCFLPSDGRANTIYILRLM